MVKIFISFVVVVGRFRATFVVVFVNGDVVFVLFIFVDLFFVSVVF